MGCEKGGCAIIIAYCGASVSTGSSLDVAFKWLGPSNVAEDSLSCYPAQSPDRNPSRLRRYCQFEGIAIGIGILTGARLAFGKQCLDLILCQLRISGQFADRGLQGNLDGRRYGMEDAAREEREVYGHFWLVYLQIIEHVNVSRPFV